MDNVDHALIALLRQNARESVATLAARLGVSRGTVANRLARLEQAGVVVGYTVRLRPDAQSDLLRAWMSIAIEGNDTRRVMAQLLGEPGVASLAMLVERSDARLYQAKRAGRARVVRAEAQAKPVAAPGAHIDADSIAR